MKNPYEVQEVFEETYDILGYRVTVIEWSDSAWTAYISKMEYGVEDVIMDNDIEWGDRPSEDRLAEYITDALEDRYDAAHP
jgi:hypothetical protein